jgi:hypothetical protein
MVIALGVAVLGFFGLLPILVRDSRRPLPLKPRRVREPRSLGRAPRMPAASPDPVHVRPELGRRLAIVATAVVALSLWSGWVGRSHSARR